MAEENMTPVAGSEPPRASTLKLKPVIRKPTLGAAPGKPLLKPAQPQASAAPAAPSAPPPPAAPAVEGSAMEQLKTVTQKLKGVTQQIPQQAILRKTGIIADQDLTEAQKQAAKSRTARISLSDAMGVAPVKNEAAPIKTIRIKRPEAISKPSAPEAPAHNVAEAAPSEGASITQRKTLKISRPGAVKPAGKFGLKKPAAAEQPKPEAGESPADLPDIADIPDMPAPAAAAVSSSDSSDEIADVSKAVGLVSVIVQLAACAAVGALGYFLYQDMQLPVFCGGCGW